MSADELIDTGHDPSKPPRPFPRVLTYVIAAAAVVVGLAIMGKAMQGSSSSSGDGDRASARSVCYDFVRDRLKAPATAQFSETEIESSGNQWTVSGSVDAQNSFGALIRNNYTCVTTVQSGQWQLESLDGLSG